MNIRAFECTRDWDETPVTIFADNLDQADQIYRKWVLIHREGHTDEPTALYVFGEGRLEARPKLDQAASLGVAGVGYWDRSNEVWVIRDPEEGPAGGLALPEGRVSYFEFEADDVSDDAKVFATSFEEATNLYCAWHLDRWGELPARFAARKRSRWDLLGVYATLRDGLEAGVSGVARLDNDGVWRILEPDWEPIYGRD